MTAKETLAREEASSQTRGLYLIWHTNWEWGTKIMITRWENTQNQFAKYQKSFFKFLSEICSLLNHKRVTWKIRHHFHNLAEIDGIQPE